MLRCQIKIELSETTAIPDTANYVHTIDAKQYEFSNHLGNALATSGDKLIAKDWNNDNTVDSYKAEILSATDYTQFGIAVDSSANSRHGFNGQEMYDDWNVNGGSYDFGARIYVSRLECMRTIDPLWKCYALQCPYGTCTNNSITYTNEDGENPQKANNENR